MCGGVAGCASCAIEAGKAADYARAAGSAAVVIAIAADAGLKRGINLHEECRIASLAHVAAVCHGKATVDAAIKAGKASDILVKSIRAPAR